MLVAFCIATIWPPQKKIALGLDIQGGTSFLIRLKPGEKQINKAMLDQAVEVIRKRVDYFGASEPIISPVGNDRILVQIPGLDTAKIQEARDQLSRVAKLEFRLVYRDNGERLKAIDEGKEVIPPDYRIEVHKLGAEGAPMTMSSVRLSRAPRKNQGKNGSWSRRKPTWAATELQLRTLTTATRVGRCS